MLELFKYYHIKPYRLYDHLTGLVAILKIRRIQKQYIKYHNFTGSSQYTELKFLMAKEEYYRSQFDCYGKWNRKIAYDRKETKKFHNFMNWLFPPKPINLHEDYHVLATSREGMLLIKNKLFKAGFSFELLMGKAHKQRKNKLYGK